MKKEKGFKIDLNDPKTKLFLMVLFIVIVFVLLAILGKNNPPNNSNSPFNINNKRTEEKQTDSYENHLETIKSLASKSYEYVYTIEPDEEDDYFYLRASVDGSNTLYYKKYKDKEYVYLKKGYTYYKLDDNILKKTNKKISYEGYDTVLFNTANLYYLFENSEFETIKDKELVKYSVKVDMNKLIEIYNSENDGGVELVNEARFINFYIYKEDKKLVVNTDLKDYYKYVYGKEFNDIYYDLEFYNIGTTSLAGIEEELTID